MLSARNLCGLLSENTDEYASEYVVFTTHGTLLGYSDTIIIKKARKVAALLGVTWRSANQAQSNNNQRDCEDTNNPTLLLKVLTTIRGADGKLSIMTVEIDKMIAAICDVKESLLVAALVEDAKLKSTGAGSQLLESVSGDDDDDTATVDVEESSRRASHSTAPSDIEQVKPSSDSVHEEEEEEEEEEQEFSTLTPSKGKSKGDAEDSTSAPTPAPASTSASASASSSSSSSSSSKPKPSQMQILIWRSEAMAEALRDDLRDFKMPQGII